MTDLEKARQLFRNAGLAFPMIPTQLAVQLKERDQWLFSTREIKISPYILEYYICEVDGTHVEDYVVLAHSGHGVNSYALQYYLVHGALRMFLHLGWGGVYMNSEAATGQIRECFSLANRIIPAAQSIGRIQAGEYLMLVGSDFYGSYWVSPGKNRRENDADHKTPLKVLNEVLRWLESSQCRV